MEDIAERAGVSRATVYHYYPKKRDMYVAIFRRASLDFSCGWGSGVLSHEDR
ncbi:TetR/AcrR family transcriptional regulator [Mycobacterium sp. HUMS_1102779]